MEQPRDDVVMAGLACYLYNFRTRQDDCKNCKYNYGWLNENGDHPMWECDYEEIMKDALYLLANTKRILRSCNSCSQSE